MGWILNSLTTNYLYQAIVFVVVSIIVGKYWKNESFKNFIKSICRALALRTFSVSTLLANNLRVCAYLFICGMFGAPLPLLIANGLVLGYLLHHSGIVLFLACAAPHGITEMFGFIIFAGIGLKVNNIMTFGYISGDITNCIIDALVGVILMVCSSIVEVHITPIIAKIMIPKECQSPMICDTTNKWQEYANPGPLGNLKNIGDTEKLKKKMDEIMKEKKKYRSGVVFKYSIHMDDDMIKYYRHKNAVISAYKTKLIKANKMPIKGQ